MRHRDEEYIQRVRAENQSAAQMKLFDEMIRPTMVDLHTHLKQSTSKTHLSAHQLEALARWKLGLPSNATA